MNPNNLKKDYKTMKNMNILIKNNEFFTLLIAPLLAKSRILTSAKNQKLPHFQKKTKPLRGNENSIEILKETIDNFNVYD